MPLILQLTRQNIYSGLILITIMFSAEILKFDRDAFITLKNISTLILVVIKLFLLMSILVNFSSLI